MDGSDNGAYFERSSDGFLVSERTFFAGTQSKEYFYYFDALGSVIGMVDASTGTQAATFTYDPYGKNTGTTGTAAPGNPFRYTGAYLDGNGLYLMGARYYNPRTGTFLSQDADNHAGDIGQGDRYSYAGDDPANNTDPSGAFSVSSLFHDALDVAAVPPYAAYYASYEADGFLHAPVFAETEAVGIGDDAGLDFIKGHTVADESVCDEGQEGGILTSFIDGGGPQTYLPGLDEGTCHLDFR